MKSSFRASMTWLHTWTGLLLGWVLFAIFVTGTATYFKEEITRWMQPELRAPESPRQAATVAHGALERLAPRAARWLIALPDDRARAITVYWQEAGERRYSQATIDPVTGERITARDTRGGEFFYRFHFQLQLPHPWGRYLAGVAALFMFVALITGVISHRQMLKETFVLRPGAHRFRALLDVHNLLGTLALPFFALISYSALIIFAALYLPWGRMALPKPDQPAARGAAPVPAAPNHWIPPADFNAVLADVARIWPDGTPFARRIDFTDRGTERARILVVRDTSGRLSIEPREERVYQGATGELIAGETKPASVIARIHGSLYGLHLARFAGPALRSCLFLLGVMGTGLIATGLVLWTLKRRTRESRGGGFQVVDRMNVAVMAGLFVAVGAFFWSNRLLPVGLSGRGDMEVQVFLYAWLAALVHAWVRPVTRAWREQSWTAGVLLVVLPVLDAVVENEFFGQALRQRELAYVGFLGATALIGLAVIRLGSVAARLTEQSVASAPGSSRPAPARVLIS